VPASHPAQRAEAELVSSGPSGIVPGIVAHFGKLFDVKHLDGMFPRMSVRQNPPCVRWYASGLTPYCGFDGLQELFLFVNEMRNFTAVLKDLLDLGDV
jgi:hypothetical protein